MTAMLVIAIGLCITALLILLTLLFSLRPSLPLDRRRPFAVDTPSQLSRFAGAAVRVVDQFLTRHPQKLYRREVLDTAGLRFSQADFIILVITAGFVTVLIGLLLGGPLLAILFSPIAPMGAHLLLSFSTARRRSKFDQQLTDTLQLLTGGLRAGHSILRAIDAAATEADSPTSEEMRRVITETSLGKDLLASLLDTARRMNNEDLNWLAQAIQINREVGGDLAEVLDHVGDTIRERSEIKGQIKALAAEGKFSAYILMALPFGIVIILSIFNPGYMNVLFTDPLGWVMIGVSIVMMTIGGLWMRKMIDLKF